MTDPDRDERVGAVSEEGLRHIPEQPGATIAGCTYCKRCGLLLTADRRPDLDPERKPCRIVRIRYRSVVP